MGGAPWDWRPMFYDALMRSVAGLNASAAVEAGINSLVWGAFSDPPVKFVGAPTCEINSCAPLLMISAATTIGLRSTWTVPGTSWTPRVRRPWTTGGSQPGRRFRVSVGMDFTITASWRPVGRQQTL